MKDQILKEFKSFKKQFIFENRCNIFTLKLWETDNKTIYDYFVSEHKGKVKF